MRSLANNVLQLQLILIDALENPGATVWRRTYDRDVEDWTVGLTLLRNNLGQVVHTFVTLPPTGVMER